ncbi:GntR family transcriptional regulator [Streptomyces montanisoli]|uniref:GntR family transcriptional regulator n=1 Tax=Streptomyces montanisoli TaxID=2798581 RepID=A0A940M9D9_9ACTN|nr:GntR family transcriptional regulator [Streptomyces montanisoli]MBP0457189.1 GntR family transcriptional regulator [Streptomyces montanisoli]
MSSTQRREAGMPTVRRPATAKRDLVRRHLVDIIESAGPGTGLASERDLALELGVSRPTVRAAVEELIHSGLLVRRHGQGTFTSPHKVTQELSGTTTNGMAVPPAEGHWTSRIVSFRTTQAGPTRAQRLEVPPDEPVRRVTRVRLVDDEPMAIEHLELPAALVPTLTATDLEHGNFYQLLRERFDIRVRDALQTLEPTVTNPEQAELLGVSVYAPVLRVERTTRDVRGRVVELAQSFYRGDRYRITSKLRFDDASG